MYDLPCLTAITLYTQYSLNSTCQVWLYSKSEVWHLPDLTSYQYWTDEKCALKVESTARTSWSMGWVLCSSMLISLRKHSVFPNINLLLKLFYLKFLGLLKSQKLLILGFCQLMPIYAGINRHKPVYATVRHKLSYCQHFANPDCKGHNANPVIYMFVSIKRGMHFF